MQRCVGVVLVVLASVVLAACGSKTDANEKNFSAALSRYLDRTGRQCLDLTMNWPVIVTDMELQMPFGNTGRVLALEAAGLVRGEEDEVGRKDWDGEPTGSFAKVRRYVFADAASPFIQEKESFGGEGRGQDLCWGRKTFGKLVKWEGPMKFGEYQEALLTYTYKLQDVAPWARDPRIQEAFTGVKETLDGVDREQEIRPVGLTSEGWEAKGLD